MNDLSPAPLLRLSDADLRLTYPADDIRGNIVIDQAGFEMGYVEDLLIDPAGRRVLFMIVHPSGMLLDDAKRIIPVDAVRRHAEESVRVDQDFERVAAGPRYAPELIADPGYQAGVYGWYGFVPYWHPGYVHATGWPQR
jgi:sporulation protein YlmC with PRC-barrel domain